jgi:hypothetical protein
MIAGASLLRLASVSGVSAPLSAPLRVMIAQAPLVAPQLLLQAFGRHVEAAVGGTVLAVRLQRQSG